jgi:hypothetical protein
LDVVPPATSEWKPDTAPQAIRMKSMGHSGPCVAERQPVKKGAFIAGLVTARPTNPRSIPISSTHVEM